MAEAIVVHEDDSIDELLEVVGHHGLRQLLVMGNSQQVQQIWAIHQLPLHKHQTPEALQLSLLVNLCKLGWCT